MPLGGYRGAETATGRLTKQQQL